MRLTRRAFAGLAAGLLLALVGALGFGLESASRPTQPPSFESVRNAYRSSEALLLDRNGVPLQSQRMDLRVRRLMWTPLDQISPALIDTLIAAEDRRFRSHGGIDGLAIAGAMRDRLTGRARRGASTLQMQLAAQLDPDLTSRSRRRRLIQKLRQARTALQIADSWTREQVLEAYLNRVGFRGETQGIAAASAQLFDKPPRALNAAESRVLIALLPAPAAAAATVARRACAIGGLKDAPCDAQRQVAFAALAQPPAIGESADLAPHLARRLLRNAGEQRRSTLDATIQQHALSALQNQLRGLESESVRDGAAVVVDNASGELLAYVGSAGPASRSPQVDGARALRQAGSTLKPFLYALAIERRWLTAASLLDDSPLALEAGPGLYRPQNYEHAYLGPVSVRTALAGSLNIPAVHTLVLTGVETFREQLHALGYVDGLTESGEYYGYSLALGSAEVSLLEQANAYRALANGGLWSPLRLEPESAATTPHRVMSAQSAFIVRDILADRSARAVTFDLEGPLSTPYRAWVKTGTSKDLRDNWCIGGTARRTVAVWVGNFEGDPMRTVSGISGAAPAWREILDSLPHDADAPDTPPDGVVHSTVRYVGREEPEREEWFISGTETAVVQAAPATAARARIVSPAQGSLIALDPDIPLSRQHVPLTVLPASAKLNLELDGLRLGHAGESRLWTPVPGRHRLRLLDAQNKALDSVEFEVRAP
jgi:penicillin-binding protein 1C